MRSRLELLTDDLETLYDQEMTGAQIDLPLANRTLAVFDTLDDADWWEIATCYWPLKYGRTLPVLEAFLSWLQDSPIWNR